MPLAAGMRLGPYEVLTPIGAGGMGEVWKARDTRLNRFVAIKSSHRRFSERFHREAKAIAALNHPHICSLYDVGPDYLVMEYVDGTRLHGPVPLDEALRFAGQILDALDVAHRKGITHRDLKPGNLLLGPNGVKVVDFGLAKMERPEESAGGSEGATATLPLTAEGKILGTPQYMAPEQIEGREADARSDIFAFGIVLYELISGQRPFTGKSEAGMAASILKEPPGSLRELQPRTPPGLERVIQTCLEKNPEKRWQSAREVRHALEWAAAEVPPVSAPPARLRIWQGVAALAILATLALSWMAWSSKPVLGPTIRLAAPLPEDVTLYGYVSVSPDGRKLAFTSGAASNTNALWIRDLNSAEWHALPETEGALSPFWSPDSRYIAFADGSLLKKIAVAGGPPQTLCTMTARIEGSGSWNQNGVIIFGSWGGGAGGPLWKIPESGGAASALTEVDTSKGELFHTWPTFTGDGTHFLYFRSGPADVAGIYAGSINTKPGEQPRDRILATEFPASYANGYLFFLRANTLLAQPLDPDSLKLKGEAIPVGESLQTNWFGTGVYSVSSSGILAYQTSTISGDLQLTWFDRQGKVLDTVGPPGPNWQVSISPDGTRAAVRDARFDSQGDLWTIEIASGRRTRLTFLQSDYSPAVWSPDGNRIVFSGGKLGDTIYEKASSGGGEEKVLLRQPGMRLYPTSWSHDGRFLLYHTENTPNTGADLWVLPLEGNHKPVRLLGEAFNEWAGVFSPDGHWIAYASTEMGVSGTAGTYVRPFLAQGPSGAPAVGQGKWQVSREVGNWPKWIGKEIIFSDVPRGVAQFAVQLRTSEDSFASGAPQKLFAGPLTGGIADWDVSPDGQRFLWPVPRIQQTGQVPITVVLNWQAVLKR